MGSFDVVEVCELVSVLILSQLSNVIKNTNMRIYRDDGLIIIGNPNEPKLDSCRKRISKALKLLEFRITMHTNLKIVNFLDVTLNLSKDIFELYKKSEWHTHLHTHFFKPPTLNYQTNPKSISCRLSNNSSNIKILTNTNTYMTMH